MFNLFVIVLSLIALHTSNLAAADTVTTPFTLQLNTASTLTLLGGVDVFKSPNGEFKTDLPNQSLTTPYAVAISGIHLTLDYAFNSPAPVNSLGEWSIQSKSVAATLLVDSIDASQTIVEQSGGTTLTVRLNATCRNVKLALSPNSTQVNATVDLSLTNGTTSFLLKNFQANWTPSAWQIVSMDCQGPSGFSDLVRQNAATQLESINPFLPAIQTQVQSQLNSAAAAVTSWTLNPNNTSGVSITLKAQQLHLLDAGASMSGSAIFNFTKLNQTACQSILAGEPSVPSSADTLATPLEATRKLLQCSYLNHSMTSSFTSAEFPSFQALLQKGFLKALFWPDLLRFDSSSIFQFQLFPSEEPSIGEVESDGANTFFFDLSVPLTLSIFAPTETGSQHYVNLSSDFSAPASLSFQNGVIFFQQDPGRIQVSTEWDPQYVEAHDPVERICRLEVAHGLRKLMRETGLSYTLPTWQEANAFSLSIKSAALNGTDVSFALSIKTLTSP